MQRRKQESKRNKMNIIERPRKVVNSHYSYFVSLPMAWCRSHNIGKGDIIQPIILEDGNLLIKPIKKKAGAKK